MCVAQAHKACGLIGAVRVDGTAVVAGVVGDNSQRAAFYAGKYGDIGATKSAAQFQHAVDIG